MSPVIGHFSDRLSSRELWRPVSEILQIARGYDGVTGGQIDAVLQTPANKELLECFKSESAKRPLLAPVIVPTRESIAATFLYGCRLMRSTTDRYSEWPLYEKGMKDWSASLPYHELSAFTFRGVAGEMLDLAHPESRMWLVPGARPFSPNELALHFVDFGANWDRTNGVVPRQIQNDQAPKLAVFDALFAASQHPRWARCIGDEQEGVPCVMMAALPFLEAGNLSRSPLYDVQLPWLIKHGPNLELACAILGRYSDTAFPVLWP